MPDAKHTTLSSIRLTRYRKARDVVVETGACTVLIGPNAAGKSTVLDGLRFLATAARTSFWEPVLERGGLTQLAWKGEAADRVQLETRFESPRGAFVWRVKLRKSQRDFRVEERLTFRPSSGTIEVGETVLLERDEDDCWWRPGIAGEQQHLRLDATECVLSIASRLDGFLGREVYDHVLGWVFADPNPGVLRIPTEPGRASARTPDLYGRDLALRLSRLDEAAVGRVIDIVRDVTGVPVADIEWRELDDGRLGFSVRETGLQYPVNQQALSAGSLRALAIAVTIADAATGSTTLLALEEPENYLHPAAAQAFGIVIAEASSRIQVLLSTHSPLLLDALECEGRRIVMVASSEEAGTLVQNVAREEVADLGEAVGLTAGQRLLLRGFGTGGGA